MIHRFKYFSRVAAASLALLPFLPVRLWATGFGGGATEDEQLKPISEPGDLLGSLVWVMVSLAIVIVLVVFAMKWLSRRNRIWGANRSLRSLGGISLGQSHSLQVVELSGRIYIVGVGEDVTLLDKLDDPDQVAEIVAAMEQQHDGGWLPTDWGDKLRKLRTGGRGNDSQGSDLDQDGRSEADSFQQMLQKKLMKQADRKQQLESMLQDKTRDERLMEDEK
ncbi:flagellar biosynthetic protein FliO [Paenibacillus chungangensis]|uniref:Flagellar biosynthetic protein FliO n=1 Tax=Paenibacillus chungangensis TaxID=696535 RepID=A0ABW3HPN1_9BACL